MSLSKQEEQLAYELSCPICLQLYSDPVVLPCGHNYCQNGQTLPRCPECRKEYQGVETLQKNFKLNCIIEGFRATNLSS
uniref:RING-type domain-containing protein n=1 Tax=Dicentrarchus labrax TaxID=13489 RepID=A0A8C4GKK8_DICLA